MSSSDGTDPTTSTCGSYSQSKPRGKYSLQRARSWRSRPNRERSSIFGTRNKDGPSIIDSECKSLRQLPTYDFLQKDDEEKEGGSLLPGTKWWHSVFLLSVISMAACIITLWAPYPIGARMPTEIVATMPWSNGCQGIQSCICPRETICADDLLSMIFLTIARTTAWANYPLYMMMFISKANNLNNFLQTTALRCWINFSDYHRVHTLFGIIVGFESTNHTFFHILRWARRNHDIQVGVTRYYYRCQSDFLNLPSNNVIICQQLLWTSTTGITGIIAFIVTPFIVLPMTVPYFKKRISFEWRKLLHYLCILWAVALMYHAPQKIFWLIGIPCFVYLSDKILEGLFRCHLIESAHFERLGDTSCLISFENPPGFGKQNCGYVYLMLPWLSKYQFHAFSVFPSNKPNQSSICIHKCGDWTGKLMNAITTPTHKPSFVVGPFLSPFSSPAMDSENLVAVASGIGVTPAISLIKQYSSTSRRLNLVWICRDAGLVEHFIQNVNFGHDGYTLIYYTGCRSLIVRDDIPSNVFIFNSRPNLERTISGIIASIAAGTCLPEELNEKVLSRTPGEMRSKFLLEKALSLYTLDQLFEFTANASAYYSAEKVRCDATVNYCGVRSTMRHLLGHDYEMVTNQMKTNFEKVDVDGGCEIDRAGFEIFFNLMLDGSDVEDKASIATVKRGLHRLSTCRNMFESSEDSQTEQQKDEFGRIKKYLQGEGKFSAKNWNILYCGGSQPVLDQLKDFKRKFGVGLSVEKFDW